VKPIAAESTGGTSPRGRPPMGETNGANPFVARERSPVGVCVVVATRFGPSVRGARTRRKVRTTLETRRTTYPPAQASSTPARERWTTRAHRTKRAWILYGNISEVGDASQKPRKSYLFFLTVLSPWNRVNRR
jgi:hypothetical protein